MLCTLCFGMACLSVEFNTAIWFLTKYLWLYHIFFSDLLWDIRYLWWLNDLFDIFRFAYWKQWWNENRIFKRDICTWITIVPELETLRNRVEIYGNKDRKLGKVLSVASVITWHNISYNLPFLICCNFWTVRNVTNL